MQEMKLLRAWAAIIPQAGQELEGDARARLQLRELLDRSLIMRHGPYGYWETVEYQMHDVLRDLALSECKGAKLRQKDRQIDRQEFRQKFIQPDQTLEQCFPEAEYKVRSRPVMVPCLACFWSQYDSNARSHADIGSVGWKAAWFGASEHVTELRHISILCGDGDWLLYVMHTPNLRYLDLWHSSLHDLPTGSFPYLKYLSLKEVQVSQP